MGFFDFLKPKNIVVDQGDVQPIQSAPVSSGSFEFMVEDVFTITGRGTVVTGRVTSGTVRVGDEVTISPSGIRTVVTGIEMFRKTLDYVQEGDNAGLLLKGVSRNEVQRGNTIIR